MLAVILVAGNFVRRESDQGEDGLRGAAFHPDEFNRLDYMTILAFEYVLHDLFYVHPGTLKSNPLLFLRFLSVLCPARFARYAWVGLIGTSDFAARGRSPRP